MTAPTLLSRHQIKDTEWNTLIDESLHPVPYAYTWYLDCVSPNWQALATKTTDGYQTIMPLPIRKKWGIGCIHQPLFCQYLGIFSRNEVSGKETEALLKSLNQHFRYISTYSFHPANSTFLSEAFSAHANISSKIVATHWLDLTGSYGTMAKGYSKDRRMNLKKSRAQQWEQIESTDIGPMVELFEKHHATKIPGGVPDHAYRILRQLGQLLLQKKSGRLFYASLQGTIHAGVLILETAPIAVYLFNASDEVGRRGNARTWLLDRYFQEKAGKGTFFDFESPEVESIAAFYESFGPEKREFYEIKKNDLPFPLRQIVEWRKRLLKAI